MQGAGNEHCLVREVGFASTQDVSDDVGAFDARNGMFNDDSFSRESLVERTISFEGFTVIGSSFGSSNDGIFLFVAGKATIAQNC